MIKIACAGDNCVDYYDNTGESFPGGNPVNVSVYVRRLGGQSAYLGAVGTDDFGKQMCAALQEKGVDVSHVQILPGKTYTLSFWAKAEGPDKMTVVIDMPSYGKKQEFQKFYPFALSGEWTKFTCKVTFPSDEAQFSLLARRRARVNIFCDNHNDGRILLDQLEFKAEE